jgi:hypothetical protein
MVSELTQKLDAPSYRKGVVDWSLVQSELPLATIPVKWQPRANGAVTECELEAKLCRIAEEAFVRNMCVHILG